MAEQIHGHMPPAADVEAVLADPAGACPDCVRLVVGQLCDALRLAESDGDSARRDLTGAYTVLTDAMPGRPATATAAAEKAVRMIRDHDAERRRALDERDEARAEVRRLRAALGGEVRRNSIPGPPSGAPDSVVRAWAREHGFPVKPKGRVAPDARAAYEAAWRAEQDGDKTNG